MYKIALIVLLLISNTSYANESDVKISMITECNNYLTVKKLNNAVECFKRAIRFDDKNYASYAGLGKSLFYLGKNNDYINLEMLNTSLDAFIKAKNLNKDNDEPYYYLSIIYIELDDIENAKDNINKLISKNKDMAEKLNLMLKEHEGAGIFDYSYKVTDCGVGRMVDEKLNVCVKTPEQIEFERKQMVEDARRDAIVAQIEADADRRDAIRAKIEADAAMRDAHRAKIRAEEYRMEIERIKSKARMGYPPSLW